MRFFLAIFFFLLLLETKIYSDPDQKPPLFSGTLLSFYADNTPPGTISVQPYLFWTRQYGFYDQSSNFHSDRNMHQYDAVLSIETGITKKVDVNLVLNASYTHVNQTNTYSFGDTQLYFGFQIMEEKKEEWTPSIRILIGENFPTGKYQNLEPELQGSDASGTGSFETSLLFVSSKTFYMWPKHPFRCIFNAFFGISTETRIDGINFYGGTDRVHGLITPGNQYFTNFAIEYKLDYHWEIGLDLRYVHQDRSSFLNKGNPPIYLDVPSTESISIAPCIAYNLDENFSASAGVWTTIAGRNSVAFTSGVFTFYYSF